MSNMFMQTLNKVIHVDGNIDCHRKGVFMDNVGKCCLATNQQRQLTPKYIVAHRDLLFVLFASNKEEAIFSGDYHNVHITRTQKANDQRIRLK